MTTHIDPRDGFLYPFPCCGYITLAEPPSSYDICRICFWENNAFQLEFATARTVGANGVTLGDAQREFTATGACEGRLRPYVHAPGPLNHRDPTWRPIDPALESFETGTPRCLAARPMIPKPYTAGGRRSGIATESPNRIPSQLNVRR